MAHLNSGTDVYSEYDDVTGSPHPRQLMTHSHMTPQRSVLFAPLEIRNAREKRELVIYKTVL